MQGIGMVKKIAYAVVKSENDEIQKMLAKQKKVSIPSQLYLLNLITNQKNNIL